MKADLVESRKLLESYDLENYITGYALLYTRYKGSFGRAAHLMLALLIGIRKSVYNSINRSFHNMVKKKISGRLGSVIDFVLLNWKFDFGEVLRNGGFDIALGNPPYVFGGNQGISSIQKEYFKAQYVSARRKLNLFSMFIERSMHLIRKDGFLSFIVPNTLLRVTSYEDCRKFILSNSRIREIVNLEAGVFEGVKASTIIITLQKDDYHQAVIANRVKILAEGISGPSTEKLQSSFENAMHIFELGSSDETTNNLLAKIARTAVLLGTLCREMIFG